MNNFNLHTPTRILFGKDAIADLRAQIPTDARVLITYGGGSVKKTGVLDQVYSALEGLDVREFGGIEPNPSYETLMNAVKIAREEQITFLLAVGGGSWMVVRGTMTLGQLTSFAMYPGLMIWPMLALAWMFNIVERGSAAYSRIRAMLAEVPVVNDGSEPVPEGPGILKADIRAFIYPQTEHPVLENVSFTLRPGQMLGICGPTGSGKSTTLYAILSTLNGHERNILTVEDPIEYELEGVGQTQVNPRVDMTFARGLRAILRQDPDVVMIGEIRDGETAQIAVQASLTGHLVMSTLHTNSAAGAITRLRDMGLESFLIGSSLLGVIAQRLVRRLCTHCRTTSPLDANEKALFSFMDAPPGAIYRAVGCEHCRQSGYQGRAGIHEFLVVDSAMRRAIHEDKDEMSLETQLFKQAYSLRENGLLKVIGGVTSLEEVMRVTAERGGDA